MYDEVYLLTRDFDYLLDDARSAWMSNNLTREQMRLVSCVFARLINCKEYIDSLKDTL